MLECWTALHAVNPVYARHKDGAALAVYRSLADRRVLGSREFHRRDTLTREEAGTSGAIGYAFAHDAGGSYRLWFVSHAKATEIARRISAGAAAAGAAPALVDDPTMKPLPAVLPLMVGPALPTPQAPARVPSPPAQSPFFRGGSPFAS